MNILTRVTLTIVASVGLYCSSFAAHAINERLAFSRAADDRIIITVTGDSYDVCGEPPPVTAEIFTVDHKIFLLPPALPPQPVPGLIYYNFPPVSHGPECIIGTTLRRYRYSLLLPAFPDGVYLTRLVGNGLQILATVGLDTRAVAAYAVPTSGTMGMAALLISIAGIAYFGLRRK